MLRRSAPFLACALLSLGSCQQKESAAPSLGLEGTWRLSHRQCYCTPAPLPDETLTFSSNQFAFYNGNRTTRSGDYASGPAPAPCRRDGTTAPALLFTYSFSTANTPTPPSVQYRLAGDTLTLDYGGPCDAPVDTYQRL
jgi:hypothetical protein